MHQPWQRMNENEAPWLRHLIHDTGYRQRNNRTILRIEKYWEYPLITKERKKPGAQKHCPGRTATDLKGSTKLRTHRHLCLFTLLPTLRPGNWRQAIWWCHYSRQERLLASANRHGHNAKQLLLQELSSKANIIRLDIQHARLQTYHQIPQNVGKIVEIVTQLHYGITDPQVGKPAKMHQKQKKYSSQL